MSTTSNTGTYRALLGQSPATGYQPAVLGQYGTVLASAEETKLRAQILELQRQVASLSAALASPDRPVASSLQHLIETMDMSDVAGRTKPPFDHLTLASLMGAGLTFEQNPYTMVDRDGDEHGIKVVGLIVESRRTSIVSSRMPVSSTYMIPTPSLTADKAFEAAADLIAHTVVERVLKKMEIEDGTSS